MDQQYRAVATGYWPLVRYDPVLRDAGRNPFLLDSHRPRLPLSDYTGRELRYRILARTDPEAAERLSKLAQQQVSQRWATCEEMAARSPEWFPASGDGVPAGTENGPIPPSSPWCPGRRPRGGCRAHDGPPGAGSRVRGPLSLPGPARINLCSTVMN